MVFFPICIFDLLKCPKIWCHSSSSSLLTCCNVVNLKNGCTDQWLMAQISLVLLCKLEINASDFLHILVCKHFWMKFGGMHTRLSLFTSSVEYNVLYERKIIIIVSDCCCEVESKVKYTDHVEAVIDISRAQKTFLIFEISVRCAI